MSAAGAEASEPGAAAATLVVPPFIRVEAVEQRNFEIWADAPPNSSIMISGLPSSVTFSAGSEIISGIWKVPLSALLNLQMTVRAGEASRSRLIISVSSASYKVLAATTSELIIQAPQLEKVPRAPDKRTEEASRPIERTEAGGDAIGSPVRLAARGDEEAMKLAEAARKAEEARKLAEAKKAEDARNAEAAERLAAAKQAEEVRAEQARKAEEARKLTEAKKAEDARKAEEAEKLAAAKRAEAVQAEAARKAEETRKLAEAKKAEDARKAEEAEKLAAAKRAEAVQAEQARKAEEIRKLAEAEAAKQAKPQPIPSSPIGASSGQVVAALPAAPATVGAGQAERAQSERLFGLGERYLTQGNVVVARQYFLRAAQMGLASAAFKLAETYDPHELARLNIHGLTPDPAQSKTWYARAADSGIADAKARLARLGAQ